MLSVLVMARIHVPCPGARNTPRSVLTCPPWLAGTTPTLTQLSPQSAPHTHTLMILGHRINLKQGRISPSSTLPFSYNH